MVGWDRGTACAGRVTEEWDVCRFRCLRGMGVGRGGHGHGTGNHTKI